MVLSMKEETDQEIIREYLDGNTKTFNVLINRYQYAVYGMCYHFTHNFADAKDLTQETFIQAFTKLHQLRNPQKFSSWLRQITVNVYRMWKRNQDRYSKVSIEKVSEENLVDRHSPSPQKTIEINELRAKVRRAISSLSEKNRLALTLYYIDGLSYEEIGTFLDVPKATIKSRLYKARKKLKKEVLQMTKDEFQKSPLPEDFSTQLLQEVELTQIYPLKEMDDLRAVWKQQAKQIMPVLILTSKEKPNQHLPIFIGFNEGSAIFLTRKGVSPPRPLTHDLIVTLLKAVGATVKKVIVTDLRENTFFGRIILECNGEIKEIDSRPSDAIAIAIRLKTPIFVAKKIEKKDIWIKAGKDELKEPIQKLIDKIKIKATHIHK